MILQKTTKAQEELQPGTRQLSQRARSLLLLAGGKSMGEISTLLGSDHAVLARQLVEQGYLQLVTAHPTPSRSPEISALPPANDALHPAGPAINMASMRMYLFDMCERLFANRHEALAQTLRMQLREARDLQGLRCAGISLLTAVQEYAGQERAQSLRERLGALLVHDETDPATSSPERKNATA